MAEHGIQQYAQDSPLMLSFGEKRRLNICAMVPHDPGIIVLDEPFAGQDEWNTRRIMGDLARLRDAGKTVLMVAHEIDAVFRDCDRIVFFRAGSILADDTPSRAIGKIRDLRACQYLPGACENDHQIH